MRGLRPVLEGRTIEVVTLRRDGLRFPFPPDFAQRLTGKRISSLSRRAKYILASLASGDCLLVHLGMTGRFTVFPPKAATRNLGEFYFETGAEEGNGAHDHVVLSLDDGARIVYTDPRRFGIMDVFSESAITTHRLLRDIGIEPLGNEMSAPYLAERFRGKAAPLKPALLDQRIIAGLGNIYVSEVLHRAGLSPKRNWLCPDAPKARKRRPILVESVPVLTCGWVRLFNRRGLGLSRCGERGRRNRGGLGRRWRRSASRGRILVEQLHHLPGDINRRGCVENRAGLRTDIDYNRKAIVAGVLVDHRHHPAANFLKQLLLLLVEFGRGVFTVALQRLLLDINVAHQLVLLFFASRVGTGAKLCLERLNLALAAFDFLPLRHEPGFQFLGRFLSILGADDGVLEMDNGDLRGRGLGR